MRFLIVGLLVGVAFVAGRLSTGVPARAQVAGPRGPSGNGDVNGDGAIDIGDASYLLNWLFLGGPAPAPCDVLMVMSGLADTGQSTCYDDERHDIDCASETCAGQDGFYATGCPPEGRFLDNGDGMVTDACTGLMWQQNTGNDGLGLTWCNALAYCEGLDFADHDDWRLPNVRELLSLIDYGTHGPAIDPVFGAELRPYSSSTSDSFRLDADRAWFVGFFDGTAWRAEKDIAAAVRAVRTAQ